MGHPPRQTLADRAPPRPSARPQDWTKLRVLPRRNEAHGDGLLAGDGGGVQGQGTGSSSAIDVRVEDVQAKKGMGFESGSFDTVVDTFGLCSYEDPGRGAARDGEGVQAGRRREKEAGGC